MPIKPALADAARTLVQWRHDLHAHPELGFQEHRTSDLVAERLTAWGITVTRGLAGTGLVGTLRVGDSPRAIGLRADMDALPMQEDNTFAHRSRTPGVMHACGHDGHTTMLLGAAHYLAQTRHFDGTVHFIFQPAEEGLGGGRVMVEEGLFDRFPCDAVFGIHNAGRLALGEIGFCEDIVTASSDTFTIRITGKGGHAANPAGTIDPVVIGAQIVQGLQSIVSRRTGPLESAVVSITQFHAGTTSNVIPNEAVLNGTVRALDETVRNRVAQQLHEIAQGLASAHGAHAEVNYQRGYPPVVNAPQWVEQAAAAAQKVVGAARVVRHVPPTLGGEDFSYMARRVPGCFLWLGQGQPGVETFAAHHPRYDFNDQALPLGASFWAELVEHLLPLPSVVAATHQEAALT